MSSAMPHSREAEEAVVGCILIDPSLFPTAPVQPKWFFIDRIRFIWETYTALQKKGMPIDILTVTEQLDAQGQLEEIGGAAYLTSLLNRVPTTINFDGYVNIMREHALRRNVISGCNAMVSVAYDLTKDTDQILASTDKIVHTLVEHASHEGTVSAAEAVDNHNTSEVGDNSVPTGFMDTDRILDGGVLPQDLVLIAGRPGQGKTASLVSMIAHMAITQNRHIAVYSMEMSTERVIARIAANLSKVDSKRIRKKDYDEADAQAVENAMTRIARSPIYFDEHVNRTPSQVRLSALRLHDAVRLDAIVIDYIQLMYGDNGGAKEGRAQEVSQISRELKNLARELNVPVIAACQLSRAVEQRSSQVPQLSDLRESGSLEQDADVVIFLHEIVGTLIPISGLDFKAYSMQHIVAKHRDGGVGIAPYLYVKPLSRFFPAQFRR